MNVALAYVVEDQGCNGAYSLVLDISKLRDKNLAKAIRVAVDEQSKLPHQCPDGTSFGDYEVVVGEVFTEINPGYDRWKEAAVKLPAIVQAAVTLRYDNPANLVPAEYIKALSTRK